MDAITQDAYSINFFTQDYLFLTSVRRSGTLPKLGKILRVPKLAQRTGGLELFRITESCYQEERGELRLHYMAYAVTVEAVKHPDSPQISWQQDQSLLRLLEDD